MNEFDILGRGGSFLFWRKGLVSTLIETLLEYTCGGISPRDKLFYVCYLFAIKCFSLLCLFKSNGVPRIVNMFNKILSVT